MVRYYKFIHPIVSGGLGQGGAVVTHSPPTSEVGGSNPGLYVGKLAVADGGQQFTEP